MAIEVGIAFISRALGLLMVAVAIFAAAGTLSAQSTEQAFPTAVTESEISGSIRARDVGDARLTTYFYTFSGAQGDLFLNVVTRNFNGDIDLFVADGLRPLTKIVVYSDLSQNETGRVVYLRKPEKLLLRISGRTPNDEAAEFRFKFAGSFVAAVPDEISTPPKLPDVRVDRESGIRVNSVGTILPPLKRPVEEPKADVAKQEDAAKDEAKINNTVSEKPEKTSDDDRPGGKPVVVITDNLTLEKPPAATRAARRPVRRTRRAANTKTAGPPPDAEKPAADPVATEPAVKAPPKTRAAKPKPPDPMENIQLLILFKDGRKIERPMTEVLRFTVDRGILTVISKNGTVSRYSILDVESVSIK